MTGLTPQVEHVQQYDDVNTTAFARFGQGTGTGTIRRAVWGPLVQSSQAACEFAGRFDAAARLVAPGASSIICDGGPTERSAGPLTGAEQRWLGDFRQGWFARSLVTCAQAAKAVARFGFEPGADIDLTSYLQLGRPRDRTLRALLPILEQLPIAHHRRLSWRGGDALQRCLTHGLVGYRYVTWGLRA